MRKIIITSSGLIESKGVYGPVLSPYMESDLEIKKMIARGAKVEEVLEEGETRILTTTMLTNNKTVKEHRKNEVKPIPNPATVQQKQQPRKEQYNNKKNKNKHNNKPSFEVDILECK